MEEAQYDGERIAQRGLDRKRFSINAVTSIFNYVLVLAIGIWYTPFMLRSLPEEIYGIIPLTTSFLQYMLLLMTALSASIGRYVTADLSRGDLKAANATFNGFFFGGLKLVAVILVAIAAFCYVLPLRIPPGYTNQARILAAAVFCGALSLGFCNVFDTAIWVTSRFEIRHLIDITSAIIRNGVVVLLFVMTPPALWQVAVAVTLSAVFHCVSLFVVWKKLTPELRIDRSAMTPESRGILFTTGGWILAVNLGTAMLMSSDLIVINRFFDTVQGAKYAVILLWVTVLRGIFGSLGAALMPSLVAMEARQDTGYLLALSSKSIRVSGALCAHCAGLLTGMALPVLNVWLHKPWTHEVAPLAWFVLFPVCFEVAFTPLLPAILTTRPKVKTQAAFSISIGVLGVVLAVALVSFTSLGIYGVALASACAAVTRYAIVNPIQSAVGLPGVRWYFYVKQALPIALRYAGTAVVALAAARYFEPSNLFSLAGCAVAVTLLALPVNLAFLPREDHKLFLRLLRIGGAAQAA